MWTFEYFLYEWNDRFVHQKRGTLGRVRAQSAGVVDMEMRGREILYRLTRKFVFEGFDYGDRSLVEQRRFHDEEMVLHLDHHAVMAPAANVVNTGSNLLELHLLLASEIRVGHAHNDPAQGPLRHDPLADF